ncbi:type II toxin-antitoxin system RelE/ParE family toxin [Anabaena sp. FACHB-709]|uniref:type II toxin-antitoxin system RelE/ParE family toxin n=1 Tax=Nostocaceae TaxID=1162 RepID=UPI0022A9EFFC|nr:MULTISPECIES: type II toxin-antitoxin system RelE/ParE family toxin [Nostocaceae]
MTQRKLDQLNTAISLNDMKVQPVHKIEPVKSNREGHHIILINHQYFICFRWKEKKRKT